MGVWPYSVREIWEFLLEKLKLLSHLLLILRVIHERSHVIWAYRGATTPWCKWLHRLMWGSSLLLACIVSSWYSLWVSLVLCWNLLLLLARWYASRLVHLRSVCSSWVDLLLINWLALSRNLLLNILWWRLTNPHIVLSHLTLRSVSRLLRGRYHPGKWLGLLLSWLALGQLGVLLITHLFIFYNLIF